MLPRRAPMDDLPLGGALRAVNFILGVGPVDPSSQPSSSSSPASSLRALDEGVIASVFLWRLPALRDVNTLRSFGVLGGCSARCSAKASSASHSAKPMSSLESPKPHRLSRSRDAWTLGALPLSRSTAAMIVARSFGQEEHTRHGLCFCRKAHALPSCVPTVWPGVFAVETYKVWYWMPSSFQSASIWCDAAYTMPLTPFIISMTRDSAKLRSPAVIVPSSDCAHSCQASTSLWASCASSSIDSSSVSPSQAEDTSRQNSTSPTGGNGFVRSIAARVCSRARGHQSKSAISEQEGRNEMDGLES
mmetsp:Transcript_28241/g.72301  ORF Transcript_28241/g.72301 Transcript_28241/m.72301 type:complete len:304 (+) Transcript_28241:666-1577(+)